MNSLIKKPSAWLPIAMSLAVLMILLGYFARFGIVRETDEGAAAHLFQILMSLQAPIILFFAIKWLPRNPKPALAILALQFAAALLPLGLVFFSGVSVPVQTGIEYSNGQYGFSFYLPQDWKAYSVVAGAWEGDAVGPQGNVPVERGPLISIKNPKWTAQNPYQDIPIMIFTLAQWDSLQRDQFHIGAAPINPSELGRNSRYVFALPARYNYAFPAGWEEVQNILNNRPLHAFNL